MLVQIALSWQDITRQETTETDLASIGGALSAEDLLRHVSVLSVMRANREHLPDSQRRQDEISWVNSLCSRSVAIEAVRRIRQHGYQFLFDEQLLLAAKIAVLYGRETTNRSDHGALGELLLRITDFLAYSAELASAFHDQMATPIHGFWPPVMEGASRRS